MPCLLVILALISPRLALVATWLLTDMLDRAFETWLLPVLGFLLVPWTTLAWAATWSTGTEGIRGFEWFLLAIALLADLSAHRGTTRGR